MALSVERARELVTEFCQTYPAALKNEFKIRLTPQELVHETQRDNPQIAKLVGAFSPAGNPEIPGRCYFACANALHDDDFRQTLRHELLGHFGLNTFTPAEKRAVLSAIVRSQEEPGLTELWALVNRRYPDIPPLFRAEEVFAFACEAIHCAPPAQAEHRGQAALTECQQHLGAIDVDGLQALTELVALRMKSRHLSIETFPISPRHQFDKPHVVSEGHFIGQVLSARDGWIEQRIGRDGNTVFHAKELLSQHIDQPGAMLDVRYSNGLGLVTGLAKAKDRGR